MLQRRFESIAELSRFTQFDQKMADPESPDWLAIAESSETSDFQWRCFKEGLHLCFLWCFIHVGSSDGFVTSEVSGEYPTVKSVFFQVNSTRTREGVNMEMQGEDFDTTSCLLVTVNPCGHN